MKWRNCVQWSVLQSAQEWVCCLENKIHPLAARDLCAVTEWPVLCVGSALSRAVAKEMQYIRVCLDLPCSPSSCILWLLGWQSGPTGHLANGPTGHLAAASQDGQDWAVIGFPSAGALCLVSVFCWLKNQNRKNLWKLHVRQTRQASLP